MLIPTNIIANADDFGLDSAINKGILRCFEKGYINSTSLMTNTEAFDEAVNLIHENPSVINIGLHINLAEGKPATNFTRTEYLDKNGNFNFKKINNPLNILNAGTKAAFYKEITSQLDRALSNKVQISHIDSHCHLHTLPCFYPLFLQTAKQYKLKIRLAQSYNEGNFLKLYFRKYINNKFRQSNLNYSAYFETVEYFLKTRVKPETSRNETVELMLHPYIDQNGALKDHFDEGSLRDWLAFLKS